jgi:hypothetical protein
MTPWLLFLYVLAAGFGLFVCFLLGLVGAFLTIAGKGWINSDDEPAPKKRRIDPKRLATLAAAFAIGNLLVWLGTKL